MSHLFRKEAPKRTCTKQYNDYHKYKPYLVKDFKNRCGYTNCSDLWFGGARHFQIDHFLPKSKYTDKENLYENLVYCCSYVNRLKSDDDNSLYLDPCNNDYNEHFERDDYGCIYGKTPNGIYMVNKLSLNLVRYAIIWDLDEINTRIEQLRMILHENPNLKRQEPEINQLLTELLDKYNEFSQSLRIYQ